MSIAHLKHTLTCCVLHIACIGHHAILRKRVGAVGDVMDEITEHVQQEFSRAWYSGHAASLLVYG